MNNAKNITIIVAIIVAIIITGVFGATMVIPAVLAVAVVWWATTEGSGKNYKIWDGEDIKDVSVAGVVVFLVALLVQWGAISLLTEEYTNDQLSIETESSVEKYSLREFSFSFHKGGVGRAMVVIGRGYYQVLGVDKDGRVRKSIFSKRETRFRMGGVEAPFAERREVVRTCTPKREGMLNNLPTWCGERIVRWELNVPDGTMVLTQ